MYLNTDETSLNRAEPNLAKLNNQQRVVLWEVSLVVNTQNLIFSVDQEKFFPISGWA